MTSVLLVFLGGGLGSLARYGVNIASLRLYGPHFPWGTLTVNVVGGFVMGVFAGYLAFKAQHAWSGGAKLFFMTGLLGGFTTFSAFSLDAMVMIERGDLAMAALYALGSVVLSIIALSAVLGLIRWLA
jgi:CrcB protein